MKVACREVGGHPQALAVVSPQASDRAPVAHESKTKPGGEP